MPALLLPPSAHGVPLAPGPVIFPNGVPVAPGPAIFSDGAFPPVPTATSSAVPEVSGTPASTPAALPPVSGPGYVAPPGVADSEISRLLSKPVDLSVTTSAPEESVPRASNEAVIFTIPVPAKDRKVIEKLSDEGAVSLVHSLKGKSDTEIEVVEVALWFPNELTKVPRYFASLPLAGPDDIKQAAIELLKWDPQIRVATDSRTGKLSFLFFPDGHRFEAEEEPDAQLEPPSTPSGVATTGQADSEGKSTEEESSSPTLQKRDADAVAAAAADGGPETATEADLSIPDNQTPLKPVGTEYSHETFWHLEQPRVRFGWAKRAERKDRFGNTPGWPIPFSVSFDEYALKLNEPYAPPKPSLRGKDIPTGGDDVAARKKKVKRGEVLLIVPDPADLDPAVEGFEPTTAEEEDEEPKEETPKEEEGQALKPRGDITGASGGDPNFSDPRLKRKAQRGGSRVQEPQPIEYDFNVEARLDNQEKPIWPFKDGFDSVMYDRENHLCVIL